MVKIIFLISFFLFNIGNTLGTVEWVIQLLYLGESKRGYNKNTN
jgi:hypothetical protein